MHAHALLEALPGAVPNSDAISARWQEIIAEAGYYGSAKVDRIAPASLLVRHRASRWPRDRARS
jgi:hypothetical protein